MLIGHLYIFFGERSIQILCPFSNWLICSFVMLWVELCVSPQQHCKRHAGILPPSTLECDLIWKQSCCKCIKMRSYWGVVGPSSNVTDLLITGERRTLRGHQAKPERQEENPVWWEAGPAVMRLRVRECPRLLLMLQDERKAWNRFFLRISRRNQPCQHLDCELLASRTIRYTSSPLSMVSVAHSQLYFPQKH